MQSYKKITYSVVCLTEIIKILYILFKILYDGYYMLSKVLKIKC